MLMLVSHDNHFSLQRCMLVIGVFGVITIISYFNELAKAGLLNRHTPRPMQQHSNRERILQRNARFNVDLSHLQKVLEEESPHHQGKINIALHIGNNQSYEKVNSSEVSVYQHLNVLHNYFLVLNRTLFDDTLVQTTTAMMTTVQPRRLISSLGVNVSSDSSLNVAYTSAVRVLLYQHESGGYTCRNCVKSLAQQARLLMPVKPLNTAYRQEWDKLSLKRKQHYKILYGSLSFGVCEKLLKPCNYMVMMPHPIDRIVQVYYHCKENHTTSDFCRFEKLNFMDLTLLQFIRLQGSGFFKKLLYYSRHCRLVGDDEVCLKDAAFSFSPKDRQIHLTHIVDNLHKWFSVVGLVNRYEESMELFEYVFKQNFTSCPGPELMKKKDHFRFMRKQIENNKQAMKVLHADIAIYNRFEEIFQQQWEVYQRITSTSTSISTTESTNVSTEVTKKPRENKPSPLHKKEKGGAHHRKKSFVKSHSTHCTNCSTTNVRVPKDRQKEVQRNQHRKNQHVPLKAHKPQKNPVKKSKLLQ